MGDSGSSATALITRLLTHPALRRHRRNPDQKNVNESTATAAPIETLNSVTHGRRRAADRSAGIRRATGLTACLAATIWTLSATGVSAAALDSFTTPSAAPAVTTMTVVRADGSRDNLPATPSGAESTSLATQAPASGAAGATTATAGSIDKSTGDDTEADRERLAAYLAGSGQPSASTAGENRSLSGGIVTASPGGGAIQIIRMQIPRVMTSRGDGLPSTLIRGQQYTLSLPVLATLPTGGGTVSVRIDGKKVAGCPDRKVTAGSVARINCVVTPGQAGRARVSTVEVKIRTADKAAQTFTFKHSLRSA